MSDGEVNGCHDCWLFANSREDWRDVMFPSEVPVNPPIGQRLGLPYLRSLQQELVVRLPPINTASLSLHTSTPTTEEGINKREIVFWQDGQGVMAISGVVWDCGLLCVDLLATLASLDSRSHPALFPFNCILDVGCGTGIAGIAALYLGAERVLFTDVCQCDALDNNLDSLPSELKSKASFVPHAWNNPFLPEELKVSWDCLLCSDLLYEEKHHEALLLFLSSLSFKCAIFAYKKRHDQPEENFFAELSERYALRIIDHNSLQLWNLSISALQGTGLYLVLAVPK